MNVRVKEADVEREQQEHSHQDALLVNQNSTPHIHSSDTSSCPPKLLLLPVQKMKSLRKSGKLGMIRP